VFEGVSSIISLVVSVFTVTVARTNHFILVHDLQELLENMSHMWMVRKVINPEAGSSSVDGLILLKIRLVNGFLDLDLSDFFDLIEVDE
jgi:hypothetical protein